MKLNLSIRALFCGVLLFTFGTLDASAAFKNWTNLSGGNWFEPLGWSPNGVPGASDVVTITNNGTYTVLVSTGIVSTAVFTIGGASGQQTLLYGSTAAFTKLYVTNTVVRPNGVLTVTNAGIYGSLLVQSGGELRFDTGAGIQIYALSLTNQGTVTVSVGSLTVGSTFVTNSGLWQFTGSGTLGYGGGSPTTFYNAGTVQKFSGTGTSTLDMDLINLPSGTVDVLSGTLKLAPIFLTNILAGSFTATAPGILNFTGNETDSGGVTSGNGTFQFSAGSFYLRTNFPSLLKFTGGDVYITGTTTFQQAGAITNLILDGSTLRGTNHITGTLTLNSGTLVDTLYVQPSGLLSLAAPGTTLLYGCTLINQGMVAWSTGTLKIGSGGGISNGGTFTITSDNFDLSYGGVGVTYFTNAGTLQKTAGTLTSGLLGFPFVNTPFGIIRAASGTLQMPNNYTNVAGEIQLANGTLISSGGLGMTGGKLDGKGVIGSLAIFDGGNVSPGPIAGLIQFSSGLTLGTNVTLTLDGTGTIPGSQFDQLSVTGAVSISNCTLQVLSAPNVPVGTTLVIITNTTANGTTGTFNGLPENALLTVGAQPFRIHYGAGNGNDVVLVRDSGSTSGVNGLLSTGGYSNTVFRISGNGNGSTIYTVQGSTNFIQWTNLGLATGDVSGNFNFIDTNAHNFRYRFYRTTN